MKQPGGVSHARYEKSHRISEAVAQLICEFDFLNVSLKHVGGRSRGYCGRDGTVDLFQLVVRSSCMSTLQCSSVRLAGSQEWLSRCVFCASALHVKIQLDSQSSPQRVLQRV